jgi:hypothetical protein
VEATPERSNTEADEYFSRTDPATSATLWFSSKSVLMSPW